MALGMMVEIASDWLGSLRPSTGGLAALAAAAGLEMQPNEGRGFRPFRLDDTVIYSAHGSELELRALLVREVARCALAAVGAEQSERALLALAPAVRLRAGVVPLGAAKPEARSTRPPRERTASAVFEIVSPTPA